MHQILRRLVPDAERRHRIRAALPYRRADYLAHRIAVLELSLQETRQANRQCAELLDVVAHVLVPAAVSEPATSRAELEDPRLVPGWAHDEVSAAALRALDPAYAAELTPEHAAAYGLTPAKRARRTGRRTA